MIHQENKGFSGARNSGLALLDSKYLMFIDSDDFLPSDDVVELLVSKAIDSDCDIVGGGGVQCCQRRWWISKICSA